MIKLKMYALTGNGSSGEGSNEAGNLTGSNGSGTGCQRDARMQGAPSSPSSCMKSNYKVLATHL